MDAATLGTRGEAAAAQYYIRQGYLLYAHGFRCREGELDLVLLKEHQIVVAEVKTRTHTFYGAPGEAVDQKKQQKLIRATRMLLSRLPQRDWQLRFDVVEVTPLSQGGYQIHCIQDAFSSPEI